MKNKYKHIYFEVIGEHNNKPHYLCRNNKSKAMLADVFYTKEWKKYTARFKDDYIFDEGCLLDIIDFLNQLKNSASSKKPEVKTGRPYPIE